MGQAAMRAYNRDPDLFAEEVTSELRSEGSLGVYEVKGMGGVGEKAF